MIRVDWSHLPDDLLSRIVENYMTRVEDYIIFSSVCRSWNYTARAFDRSELRKKWSRQMPLLMLTDGNDYCEYDRTKGRSYYAYTTELTYDPERFNAREYVKDFDMEEGTYVHSDEDDDDDDTNQLGNHLRCMLRVQSHAWNNMCYKASLPEAYGKTCWGSRYGWIVTLGRDRKMWLVNPLTRATLPLPSQRAFPFSWKGSSGKTIRRHFINRAVLLRVPRDHIRHGHISRDSPCCANAYGDGIWLVVAIHQNNTLASIAKPGDSSWTPILRPSRRNCYFTGLVDVVYCTHLNSLLFVDYSCKVYVCNLEDIDHPQFLRPFLKRRPPNMWLNKAMQPSRTYIVECDGDILIISRYITETRWTLDKELCKCDAFKVEDQGDFEGRSTFKFRVHKLNVMTKGLKEVHDLGHVALFLGSNAAICVCSTDDVGCEANSIYYIDDNRGEYRHQLGGRDMGVFKLADQTIRPFYDGHNSTSPYYSLLWFCPSL